MLDWTETGSCFEIGVDAASNSFFIRFGDGGVYAGIDAPMTLGVSHTLCIMVEADMVEAVFDDAFTLAARLPKEFLGTSLGLFANGGPVNFSDCRAFQLKNLESIPRIASGASDWPRYE